MTISAFLGVLLMGYSIAVAPPALDCTTSLTLVDGTSNVYYDKQTCK